MFLTRSKIEKPNVRQMEILVILQAVMVVCAFVSNLFALKTITFFGITAVAGNLLFPIAYCVQDIIGELLSVKRIIQLVLISYGFQLVVFGFAGLANLFPLVPGNEVGAGAFIITFGFIPRVVLASFTAFLIGSTTNAVVLKIIPNDKFGFKFRAIASTIVGEFFDTWVFLAVLGVSVDWSNALKLSLIKTLIEAIILPGTSKLKSIIEEAE